MKHVAALGLGLALLLAGPAFAQQGGHIVQRPQPAAKVGKGTAPQTSIRPAQPFKPSLEPGLQERSGAFGAMKQGKAEQGQGAFNTRMKPLGGPGYVPGQRSR